LFFAGGFRGEEPPCNPLPPAAGVFCAILAHIGTITSSDKSSAGGWDSVDSYRLEFGCGRSICGLSSSGTRLAPRRRWDHGRFVSMPAALWLRKEHPAPSSPVGRRIVRGAGSVIISALVRYRCHFDCNEWRPGWGDWAGYPVYIAASQIL